MKYGLIGSPRDSRGPGVIMKPEGSVKISVLNGSRQVDHVSNGEWMNLKVLPEAGLPRGIYQLSDAKDASKNVHPHKHIGQVLHDDGRHVYQFSSEGGIVKHNRAIFEKPPVVGNNYEIAYSRGRGQVIGEVSQEQAAKAAQKRSRSI
ncbi:conjugal transfer protein TraB [Salmonella enterica subsp. enterica serovar Enteritidis]|nr:conjugal transfer protein TraB [Salmonella enterica subsp. enterica serovar Enteritidis]